MKKCKTTFYILLAVSLLFGAAGCRSNSTLKHLSKTLKVPVNNGSIITLSDTHSGFHGDGATYIEIQFPDTACLEEIKESPDWKPFPLTENLTILVYGLRKEGDAYNLYITDDITDDKTAWDSFSKALIPEIKNGYYCFIDRHSESTDEKDDVELFNRFSYNFTIAIYDTDTDILYYVEYDT